MGEFICDTDFLIKVTNVPLPSLRAFVEVSGFNFSTIPEVVKELEGLTFSDKPLTARKAANVLRLVGKSIHVTESKVTAGNHKIETDIALFERAKSLDEDSFVATLDGKLLSRFEKNNLPYFTLRHDKPFLRSLRRATYLSTKNP
ncbi:MAG: hypothetical protein ABSE82_07345 [Nitrososphaerales archaeon]|jgi:rRNA-processing protein FCF1